MYIAAIFVWLAYVTNWPGAQAYDRSTSEGFFSTKLDMAMIGKPLQEFPVRSFIECGLRCLSEKKCESFQWMMNTLTLGVCELNSRGLYDVTNEDYLVYRPGCIFGQIEVSHTLMNVCPFEMVSRLISIQVNLTHTLS